MTERHPSPAVYGIETEYSCMFTLPDDVVHEIVGRCHSVDAQLGLYLEPDKKGSSGFSHEEMGVALAKLGILRNHSDMLSNGGRLYMDPSGPEYDTPEVTTAEEAVHRTFDGDEVILKCFESLRGQEIIKGYQVNRRVVDHNRSSRGIHLNTTTTLGPSPKGAEVQSLATLNVVKGAIFGSGGLLVDDEGVTAFHHSPRLSITTDLTAPYGQYTRRPLVRIPFKPDGEELRRVETVTSDALNFAWPLRASLVMTNALTDLLEMGYGGKLPVIENAKSQALLVGQHGNDTWISTFIPGTAATKKKRPLDVMRQICEVILEADDREEQLDRESEQVVNEVIQVADKMSKDMFSVADQVESVGRLLAINRKMERDGVGLGSEKMCRFDYAWDWLGGGIAETLRHKGVVGWQGFTEGHSTHTTKKRMSTPPKDTRAKVRAKEIVAQSGDEHSTWDEIDVTGNGDGVYIHPLSTEHPPIPRELTEADL